MLQGIHATELIVTPIDPITNVKGRPSPVKEEEKRETAVHDRHGQS